MKKAPAGATSPPRAAQTLSVVLKPITQVKNDYRTLNFRRINALRVETTGIQWSSPVIVWAKHGDVEIWRIRSGKSWVGDGYAVTPTTYLLVRIKREPNPLGMAEILERHEPGKNWRACQRELMETMMREGEL